ncbi:hypothetical protein L0F63_004375, partial [Massospora cicadina]
MSLREHPLCLDRESFPLPTKKVPKREAIPLITQGDLSHVVDDRRVMAYPQKVPSPIPVLMTCELMQRIKVFCAKVSVKGTHTGR